MLPVFDEMLVSRVITRNHLSGANQLDSLGNIKVFTVIGKPVGHSL